MQSDHLSYKDTNSFSKLMVDYLHGDSSLNDFIEYENTVLGFKGIIENRNNISIDRNLLVERLQFQNSSLKLTKSTENNISKLSDSRTFTITTGHQLNYFTGPLYYIYKTASIIKLCDELSKEFPENNFVPVFWMATEDHDFEEINNFRFKDEKFSMKTLQKGGVGRMNLKEIEFDTFVGKLGIGEQPQYLKDLIANTYQSNQTLADATRYIVNELFGEYGIVIIDGDDASLKQKMIPAFKRELLEFTSDKNLKFTNEKIKKLGYKIQVNQREINLFYLKDNFRERIVFENGVYRIINSDLIFTEQQIISELENHPERFSPNAILRPLYQETILPNLAYVGGGGELAYWFQLKQNFNDFGISFPVLVLRNSLLLIKQKQKEVIEELKITTSDLFIDLHELIKKKVKENSSVDFDLFDEIEEANKSLEANLLKYENDASKHPTFKAQHKKQLNAIAKQKKKILRTEKKNQSELVNKIENLKSDLFPSNGLQERKLNFSEMYLEFGEELIPEILRTISVLNNTFTVLR